MLASIFPKRPGSSSRSSETQLRSQLESNVGRVSGKWIERSLRHSRNALKPIDRMESGRWIVSTDSRYAHASGASDTTGLPSNSSGTTRSVTAGSHFWMRASASSRTT